MSGGNFGTPPSIPTEFQQYNSYITDPKYQTKFTIIWCSLLGLAVVCSLPHFWWGVRKGWGVVGVGGVWEVSRVGASGGAGVGVGVVMKGKGKRMGKGKGKRMGNVRKLLEGLGSVGCWAPPGLGLDIGQNAELVDNSNRAGFIALAQLPPVFLFASKNSIVSFLLGPGNGYERLNYIHRWSSRTLFLGACVHGALWIRNHLQYGIQILGSQKETSGVACLGLLCVIVITSLGFVRRAWYQGFFVVHILAFPAFFITVCYHTIYAIPWIFPPLAIYGVDLGIRMLRVRVKDAMLEARGELTVIRVRDCSTNWLPGQHLRVRVFIGGRSVFESHPLTIMNAPVGRSCLVGKGAKEESDTILLGARVAGDWTRALNKYAREEALARMRMQESSPSSSSSSSTSSPNETSDALPPPQVPILTMIDGPYGGPSVDFGEYSNVLIVAGGSGATFGVGILDSVVGRAMMGLDTEFKTRRVQFVWCIRSFGQINWLTNLLQRLACVADSITGFELQITIYVTCLCDPDAVPEIPNCEVILDRGRPEVGVLLREFLRPCPVVPSTTEEKKKKEKRDCHSKEVEGLAEEGIIEVHRKEEEKESNEDSEEVSPCALESLSGLGVCQKSPAWVGLGGGVGICACGPDSLVREAGNAVVGLRVARGVARKGGLDGLGDVGFYSEVYSM